MRVRGVHAILVGSGAIACGKYYYEGDVSLGQKRLLQEWSQAFGAYGLEIVEYLVLDQDLVGRGREKFKRKLLDDLQTEIIGFINGDDTRLKEEDRAKNNDYVAYRVASIINATTIINLTNVDGVVDQEGKVVRIIGSNRDLDNVQFDGKSDVGSGGMEVKLKYMKRFAKNRLAYICNGNDEDILLKILEEKGAGTRIQL